MTRLKLFLLWLLAFAIPVQGFAAVVQVGCVSSHGMQVMHHHAVSTEDAVNDAHVGHNMHAAVQDDTAHASSHEHHSSSSCNSCTVCTVGAILPLAWDRLIDLPATSDHHIVRAEHGFVGYTPENPERPPSTLV